MARLLERYRNCLLAGAVGDALGATVDGLSPDEAADRLDGRPVRYLPVNQVIGANTDAVQLMLFTAEGLLRANSRRRAEGHEDWVHDDAVSTVYRSYLRWLDTQRADSPPPRPDGWLVAQSALYARRTRDPVTSRALRSGLRGGLDAPINNARDPSVLPRVAPIAMASWTPWDLARDVSALTHTHRDTAHAAAALATLLQRTLVGGNLGDALETTWRRAAEADARPLAERLQAALDAADVGEPTPARALDVRGTPDAVGTLALALYAAAATDDVQGAISVAIGVGGAASRAGAAAGLLAGARHDGPLPDVLTHPLELGALVNTVADDLYRHFSGAPFQLDEDEWARFPG